MDLLNEVICQDNTIILSLYCLALCWLLFVVSHWRLDHLFGLAWVKHTQKLICCVHHNTIQVFCLFVCFFCVKLYLLFQTNIVKS